MYSQAELYVSWKWKKPNVAFTPNKIKDFEFHHMMDFSSNPGIPHLKQI